MKKNKPRNQELEAPSAQLGEMVTEAMNAQGVSIRSLAESLDITYEHARRISRGEAVPSKFILKAVCSLLELDYKELERLATQDKIRKKYGEVSLVLAGKDPTLEPIERAWPKLTDDQKKDAITMITAWAKRNRLMTA
jgi:ribosome-binding protein aMBF1 (putative translation factor)